MLPLDDLIMTLADGRFHSGVELGQKLGVSRTAVWKNLQRLSDYGIAVEKVKGLGYQIPGGLDLFDRAHILHLLDRQVQENLAELAVLPVVDSTNAWMLERLRAAHAEGAGVCLAEFQTAGRGRRGRSWVSGFGRNLCLSIGYSFKEGFAALEGLSLAVGVMVAEALTRLGAEEVALKWPNDIWMRGRKLGGILIELSGEQGGPCQVVIGLGLNVFMSREEGQAIEQEWTSLAEEMHQVPSRSDLAAALIAHIVAGLREFEMQGFGGFHLRWSQLDALKDCPVRLQGAQVVEGISRGIGRYGHLLLETAQGLQEIGAGEISLRRL